MIDYVLAAANASTLATITVLPFLGPRKVALVQLALLPISHIYLAGLALTASMASHAIIGDTPGRRSFQVPYAILIPWAIWCGAAACSYAANGVGVRSLSQGAEFVFYGLVACFFYQLTINRPDYAISVLRSLMASALFLSLTLGSLYYRHGVQIGYFIGPNEAAFHLIASGLVVPSYWMSIRSHWKEVAGGWLVVAATLATIYMGESRAGIMLGSALIASFFIAKSLKISFPKCAFVLTFVGFLAFQHPLAQQKLAEVFDTRNSFSNHERAAMIETCFVLFSEKPLTGWGWGRMEVLLETHARSKNVYPHPHNTYAHFVAEIGLGGIAFLGALFFGLFRIAVANYRGGRRAEAFFVTQCLVMLAGLGMVNDYFYGASRGVIAAVMIGLCASKGQHVGRALTSRAPVLRLAPPPLSTLPRRRPAVAPQRRVPTIPPAQHPPNALGKPPLAYSDIRTHFFDGRPR